jgi:hypothetical protein
MTTKRLLIILALFSFTKSFGQFKEGYYFTKDGKKISGLLRLNYGGNLFTDKSDGDCSLSFRETKNSKKQKFTTNEICCFVIEKDSFQQQYGFATITDWVIEKDGKVDKLNKKKFKELMPVYLSDYPELAEKVINKTFDYDDTEKIVKNYNDYFKQK